MKLPKVMEKPEPKKKINKSFELVARLTQNELIKKQALKDLRENKNYYRGLERQAYKIIAENNELVEKNNEVLTEYKKVVRQLRKAKKRVVALEAWKSRGLGKCKKSIKNWKKKQKRKKVKILEKKVVKKK